MAWPPMPSLGALMLLLAVHVGVCQACFPVYGVFGGNTLWSQNLRTPWRRWYAIGQESDANMTVETESRRERRQSTVTCLTSFSGHRYLVKVSEQDKPTKYGCLRFTPLSPQVVRRAKTKLHKNIMNVNCQQDVYVEEDAIMIAYDSMSRETCPLLGGYQLRIHEGMTVRAHCLDTILTYNPRLDFACGGDYAIADFGRDCAPTIPALNQTLYQVPFAHLKCVGSWDEPGGKVKAILFQMSSEPSTFWCMHYETIQEGNDELLRIYISFDAKCTGNAFNNDHDAPGKYSMFGIMAKYVPSTDKRCFDSVYIKKCQRSEARCFETSDCPLDCKRCNEKISKQDCSFPKDVVGHWNAVDGKKDLTIDIKDHNLKVTDHSTFSCFGSSAPKQGNVFSVVQSEHSSSCLPFYACAKIFSPAPGILNFYLRPASRSYDDGKPLSCVATDNSVKHDTIVPPASEKAIILLNRHKLSKVPCNIGRNMTFPTSLGQCRFALRECKGKCATLYGDYDTVSCGNRTMLKIEREHVCHATMRLMDNIRAIVTSSVGNERFLCWIYTAQRLFITIPEHCNDEGVQRIFSDEKAQSRYDPFRRISLPQDARVVTGGDSNGAAPRASCRDVIMNVVWVSLLLVLAQL